MKFLNVCCTLTDFCDYFLNPFLSADRVPEECVCQWHLTHDLGRDDVDLDSLNATECEKYSKDIKERLKWPTATMIPLPEDESDRHPQRLPLLVPDLDAPNDVKENTSAVSNNHHPAGSLGQSCWV